MRTVLKKRLRVPLIALSLGCLTVATASLTVAGDLRDLVEEVLDQVVDDVRITRQPIRAALTQLGEQTGLRFTFDEHALEFMPYGERTRINVTVQGIALRQGLRRMLDGIGLTMRVVDDKVHIEPAPVLERLGRRLSIEEVQLLQMLESKHWNELDEHTRTVRVRGIYDPDAQQTLDQAIARVRASNALHQLDAATEALGWYWIPQETGLLVYSRTEDVWYRLERQINLNYLGVPLDDMLIDLGSRVGVTVLFEANVLERIRAAERAVDLVHTNTTVLQTLERICGTTGTCFEVQEYGVMIGASDNNGASVRAPAGRVIAVLRVPVGDDGTTIDFPYYEDNLPPEFRHLLERKLPVVIDELRRRQNP
ncbi:MAG: hypothetical protein ABIG44_11340 [Planctomycetota bacterium]